MTSKYKDQNGVFTKKERNWTHSNSNLYPNPLQKKSSFAIWFIHQYNIYSHQQQQYLHFKAYLHFFFSSRPSCTSPMVGQRSAQGQGTRGLEWSTVPHRMRTRWLQCTRLKISGSFSDHASIVNEVSEFILKPLNKKKRYNCDYEFVFLFVFLICGVWI